MNFFGIGGFELLAIVAIAVFVIGPRRVAEMIRDFRRVYTELRRQREDITARVVEEMDLEDIKQDASVKEFSEGFETFRSEMEVTASGISEEMKPIQTALRPERFTLGSVILNDVGDSPPTFAEDVVRERKRQAGSEIEEKDST